MSQNRVPRHSTSPIPRLRSINASRVHDPVPPRLKPRGIPPALARHHVFSTDDPRQAEDLATPLIGRHRIDVAAGGEDGSVQRSFFASLHAVQLRELTVGYLDYSAEVTIRVHELPDDYLVLMPMAGTSRTSNGGEIVEATSIRAVTPSPGSSTEMHWDAGSPHLIVRISRRALDTHLTRLLGHSLDRPLEFALALDMSAEFANRWNSAIQLLHTELFHDDSLLQQGIGIGPLEEFVMSALLYVHESSHLAELTGSTATRGRRAVRAAREYIETRLAEPITIGDIADAAQVSVRSLQTGFQAELGCTPTAYVRDRRLERVRHNLLDALPDDGVTVTDVATRWGFGHLGRFASAYRKRFGESPSQTLRA